MRRVDAFTLIELLMWSKPSLVENRDIKWCRDRYSYLDEGEKPR